MMKKYFVFRVYAIQPGNNYISGFPIGKIFSNIPANKAVDF